MKVMKKKAAMKAMKVMKKKAAMKAMKVMKKKAAMKAAPAVAEPKAMKAMKAMKKKAAMKAMKAMKKKAVSTMSKTGIAETLADATELNKKDCVKALDSLAALGAKEVKNTGKFVLPGLVMIKTKVKPATQAGTRQMFGKAMKAKTVVKAFAVAGLKRSV